MLRTTAVTESKHARAPPITEHWIQNITYFSVAKNTRVPESLVVGSTDMHKEKNIEVILAYMCVKLQMRLYVCQAPCPFWVHFGSILGPFWVHAGSMLGPCWVHVGSMLGPFWVHFGSILGPFWVHFGSILGPFRVHFGSILGPFWVHFGVHLGSI